MKRHLKILAMAIVAVFLVAGSAWATQFTLIDENSSAKIDTENQRGMYNWTVDGVSHLYQQWFWYRIGNTGPEASIDTLTLSSEKLTDTDDEGGGSEHLHVKYSGSGFTIKLDYDLAGGQSGSNTSDIGEGIVIDNTGSSSLDFHFFQYSDFNLSGTANDDSAAMVNANTVKQWDPNLVLSETVATPPPSHHEVGVHPNTLNRLNDNVATTLNDNNSVSNTDATWAFQWDKTIGGGSSFTISKDKNLAPVPEPATILLMGLGLLGLGIVGRKKLANKTR